jgi:hypothetical protein
VANDLLRKDTVLFHLEAYFSWGESGRALYAPTQSVDLDGPFKITHDQNYLMYFSRKLCDGSDAAMIMQ